MKTFEASRPLGRLFYFMAALLFAGCANQVSATGPALTTVNDIVYRANGQLASGSVVISWPSFTTADLKPVAAGELSVNLASSGALTVALAPNQGASPAGTFYKVVYKLNDGSTSVEYWTVPTQSPTTISAIRATVVPSQIGAQVASKQYVDSALAGKVNDDAVVHKTGDESVAGIKTFSASPVVPSPAADGGAANKAYVDSAITGLQPIYIKKSGDSMTGVLNLSGSPVNQNHAANKQYVDTSVGVLNTNLAQKLGRLGDTPVTLAGVRYAYSFAGANWGEKVAAAITDLSASGGVVDARSLEGAQSLTADLTINKPVTLLLGSTNIAMGSNRVLISAGTTGVNIVGIQPYGLKTVASGTYLNYSGTDYALKIGDGTASTDRNSFQDIAIVLGASAVGGIHAGRTQFTTFNRVLVAGAAANLFCFKNDSSGGFSANTYIEQPLITGCKAGVTFTGTGTSNNNANQIIGGTIQGPGSGTAGSVLVDIVTGDSNAIIGTNLESAETGVRIANSYNVMPLVRFEGATITTHVNFIAGSSYNTVTVPNTPIGLVTADSGTLNSVFTPGTFTNKDNGATFFFRNPADTAQSLNLQAGSAADQIKYLIFRDRSGAVQGTIAGGASGSITIATSNGNQNRAVFTNSGFTDISAGGGTGGVRINVANASGSGGLQVWDGAASSVQVASISNAGLGTFNGGVSTAGRLLNSNIPTFVSLDTTPSVSASNVFKTNNSGATVITAFDDGLAGQRILIVFGDANTTVTDGGTIKLQGAANFISTADDTMELIYVGGNWHEIARSVN